MRLVWFSAFFLLLVYHGHSAGIPCTTVLNFNCPTSPIQMNVGSINPTFQCTYTATTVPSFTGIETPGSGMTAQFSSVTTSSMTVTLFATANPTLGTNTMTFTDSSGHCTASVIVNLQCLQNTYLNNGVCTTCPNQPSCATCTSATTCTQCSAGYGGTLCNTCLVGYTGATCNSCATGYTGYPNCACTPSISCQQNIGLLIGFGPSGMYCTTDASTTGLTIVETTGTGLTGTTTSTASPFDVSVSTTSAGVGGTLTITTIGCSTTASTVVTVIVCAFSCIECVANNVCISCRPGYTGTSCTTCASGYYASGSSCLACSSECTTCTSSTVCTVCNTGYDLIGNSCSQDCTITCTNPVSLPSGSTILPFTCTTTSLAITGLTFQQTTGSGVSGTFTGSIPSFAVTLTATATATSGIVTITPTGCSVTPNAVFLTVYVCPSACQTCSSPTVCTNCVSPNNYGPTCSVTCVADTTCNGNGFCQSDGTCACTGRPAGPNCNVCPIGYVGAQCTECADGYGQYSSSDACTPESGSLTITCSPVAATVIQGQSVTQACALDWNSCDALSTYTLSVSNVPTGLSYDFNFAPVEPTVIVTKSITSVYLQTIASQTMTIGTYNLVVNATSGSLSCSSVSTPTVSVTVYCATPLGCAVCPTSSTCTSCQPGFYLNITTSSCSLCPPNTFAPEGSTICSSCPVGSVSQQGSANCITNCATSLNVPSNCETCPTGSFLQAPQNVACPGPLNTVAMDTPAYYGIVMSTIEQAVVYSDYLDINFENTYYSGQYYVAVSPMTCSNGVVFSNLPSLYRVATAQYVISPALVTGSDYSVSIWLHSTVGSFQLSWSHSVPSVGSPLTCYGTTTALTCHFYNSDVVLPPIQQDQDVFIVLSEIDFAVDQGTCSNWFVYYNGVPQVAISCTPQTRSLILPYSNRVAISYAVSSQTTWSAVASYLTFWGRQLTPNEIYLLQLCQDVPYTGTPDSADQLCNNGDQTCVACPINCDTCSGSSTCTTCVEGYIGATCSQCDTHHGYHLFEGMCIDCIYGSANSVDGCVCDVGYEPLPSSFACVECSPETYKPVVSNEPCMPCPGACKTCESSGGQCISCSDDYYLNANGHTCLPCSEYPGMEGCATCSSSVSCQIQQPCVTTFECLSCSNGLFLLNGACATCDPTCVFGCTTGNPCLVCDVGTYLTYAGGVPTCLQCPGSCATCSDANTCTSCQPSYILDNESCLPCEDSNCLTCSGTGYLVGNICNSCRAGFYVDPTSSDCFMCGSAIAGCSTCSSSSVCTACDSGYSLDITTGACYLCSAGCASCGPDGCLECEGNGYLTGTPVYCQPCDPSCQTCNSTGCTTCGLDQFVDNSVTPAICTSCTTGCMTCVDTTTCIACTPDFMLLTTIQSTLPSVTGLVCMQEYVAILSQPLPALVSCNQAFSAYFTISDAIIPSNPVPTTAFATFSIAGQAFQQVLFYLVGSSGGFTTTLNPPGIAGDTLTVTITTNSFASLTLGVGNQYPAQFQTAFFCNASVTCPAGQYSQLSEMGATCISCPMGTYQTTAGEQTTCSSCSPGTYSAVIGAQVPGVCSQCPINGYSLGAASSCTPCIGFPACTQCTPTTGVCQVCQQQYTLNSTTNSCDNCPTNCNSCQYSTNSALICSICNIGYSLDGNGVCQPCPANCASCFDLQTCNYCNQGYFTSPDMTQCLTGCPSGTYLNLGAGECAECLPTYVSAFNSTQCTQCSQIPLPEYTPDGSTCEACTVGLLTNLGATYLRPQSFIVHPTDDEEDYQVSMDQSSSYSPGPQYTFQLQAQVTDVTGIYPLSDVPVVFVTPNARCNYVNSVTDSNGNILAECTLLHGQTTIYPYNISVAVAEPGCTEIPDISVYACPFGQHDTSTVVGTIDCQGCPLVNISTPIVTVTSAFASSTESYNVIISGTLSQVILGTMFFVSFSQATGFCDMPIFNGTQFQLPCVLGSISPSNNFAGIFPYTITVYVADLSYITCQTSFPSRLVVHCPANSYGDSTGACHPCAAGTFSYANSTACVECNDPNCISCSNPFTCVNCGVGFYLSNSICVACPGGTTTESSGSISSMQCLLTTELTYSGLMDACAPGFTFYSTLTLTDGVTPVPSEIIMVSVATFSSATFTNASGVAMLSGIPLQIIIYNEHGMGGTLDFGGSSTYFPSSTTFPFLQPVQHQLIITNNGFPDTNVQNPLVSVYVQDSISNGPYPGIPITFLVGSLFSCQATTDASGIASCVVTPVASNPTATFVPGQQYNILVSAQTPTFACFISYPANTNIGTINFVNCAAGSYFTDNSGCTQCPVGTAAPSNSNACAPCIPPAVALTAGASICCPPGSYDSGVSTCLPGCGSGGIIYYDPTTNLCTQCPDGLASPDGFTCTQCVDDCIDCLTTTTCNTCTLGSVTSALGSVCDPCDAGTFAFPDSNTCIPCGLGSISAQGATSCTMCTAPGTAPNTAQTACVICSPGSYTLTGFECVPCTGNTASAGGANQCEPCLFTQLPNSDNSQCVNCPYGQYGNVTLGICTICTPPLVLDAGQDACVSCTPGNSYNSITQSCMPCLPGYFSPDGSPCALCSPGTFATVSGLAFCNLCDVGTYQSNPLATTCIACSPGTNNSLTGQSACLACPAFTYQPQSQEETCLPCNLDSFPTTPAYSCPQCTPNCIQCANATQCAICASNYVLSTDGLATCVYLQQPTSIVLNPVSSTDCGTMVLISAVLLSQTVAETNVSEIITFTVSASPSPVTCTGTTDITGTATCQLDFSNSDSSSSGYPVVATFAGDSLYLPSQSSVGTIQLTFENPILVFEFVSKIIYNGDSPFFSASLQTSDTGASLPAELFTFSIGDGSVYPIQTCNGVGQCTIYNLMQIAEPDVSVPLSVSFAGNACFGPATTTTSVEVAQFTTLITPPLLLANCSDLTTVTVLLNRVPQNTPVVGQNITFTIQAYQGIGPGGGGGFTIPGFGGQPTSTPLTCISPAVTDSQGQATCTFTAPNIGVYSLAAVFTGAIANGGGGITKPGSLSIKTGFELFKSKGGGSDSSDPGEPIFTESLVSSESSLFTLNVTAESTVLTFEPLSSISEGQSVTFIAVLTALDDGAPIPNELIAITFELEDAAQSCEGTSAIDGSVPCTVSVFTQNQAPVPLLASFAGDSGMCYSASTTSQLVTIVFVQPTQIAFVTPIATGTCGGSVTVSIQLSPAISGQVISLTLGSINGVCQPTNSNGVSSCILSLATLTSGSFTLTANYGGSSAYAASTPISTTFQIGTNPTTLSYAGPSTVLNGQLDQFILSLQTITNPTTLSLAPIDMDIEFSDFTFQDLCGTTTNSPLECQSTLSATFSQLGPAEIDGTFQATECYSEASFSGAPVLIYQATQITIASIFQGECDSTITVTGLLQAVPQNISITGYPITFTASAQGNPWCVANTNSSGYAVCTISFTDTSAGSYMLTAWMNGVNFFLSASTTSIVALSLDQTTLVYTGPVRAVIGQSLIASGSLTDEGNQVLTGENFVFVLGTTQVCEGQGETCTFQNIQVAAGGGSYPMTVSSGGNGCFDPATSSTVMISVYQPTQLVITMHPIVTSCNGQITVSATLIMTGVINNPPFNPAAKFRTVTFTVPSTPPVSCSANTNAAGFVQCTINLSGVNSGEYVIDVEFAAYQFLLPSSASISLAVGSESDTIVYTGPLTAINGSSLSLTAIAYQGSSTSNPVIGGATFEYSLGGTQGCSIPSASPCLVNSVNQPPGSATVSVYYPGGLCFSARTVTKTIDIYQPTQLSFASSGFPYTVACNNLLVVQAILTTSPGGTPIRWQIVTFKLLSVTRTAFTDEHGVATTFYFFDDVGVDASAALLTLTAVYTPSRSSYYLASNTITTVVTVTREPTTLVYSGATAIFNGQMFTPTVTLKSSGCDIVSDEPVTFSMTGGVSVCPGGTTNNDGKASCSSVLNAPNLGSNVLGSNFVGDNCYAPSSLTTPVTIVVSQVTALIYTGDLVVQCDSTIHFAATLVSSPQMTTPIAGQVISFNAGHDIACSATTNSHGVASCTYLPSDLKILASPVTVSVVFTSPAKSYYLSSQTTAQLTVNREATSLTLSGQTSFLVATGAPAVLTAKLIQQTTNLAIVGGTVIFTLGTGVYAQTCSGVTNSAGLATCTLSSINQHLSLCSNSLTLSYSSNVCYAGNTTTIPITLFAYTATFSASSAFAVGDLSRASSVATFWSTNWKGNNQVSGGVASTEFYGWVSDFTGSSCTDYFIYADNQENPHDSDTLKTPPVTLPACMGVLITNTIFDERNIHNANDQDKLRSALGDTIVGTTTGVIIVKPNTVQSITPNTANRQGTYLGLYCGYNAVEASAMEEEAAAAALRVIQQQNIIIGSSVAGAAAFVIICGIFIYRQRRAHARKMDDAFTGDAVELVRRHSNGEGSAHFTGTKPHKYVAAPTQEIAPPQIDENKTPDPHDAMHFESFTVKHPDEEDISGDEV